VDNGFRKSTIDCYMDRAGKYLEFAQTHKPSPDMLERPGLHANRGITKDETIGVRRETVTRWHKNAFFIAELNKGFGPDTPEEAVWRQATERCLHNYMALRPDAFSEWSVKNRMEELSQKDAVEMMMYWYERAVDEQK